jgi:hypothetical protein
VEGKSAGRIDWRAMARRERERRVGAPRAGVRGEGGVKNWVWVGPEEGLGAKGTEGGGAELGIKLPLEEK